MLWKCLLVGMFQKKMSELGLRWSWQRPACGPNPTHGLLRSKLRWNTARPFLRDWLWLISGCGGRAKWLPQKTPQLARRRDQQASDRKSFCSLPPDSYFSQTFSRDTIRLEQKPCLSHFSPAPLLPPYLLVLTSPTAEDRTCPIVNLTICMPWNIFSPKIHCLEVGFLVFVFFF